MKLAVYPGSFDPVTNGHLDIIERAAQLFDKLIVAVSINAGKKPLFSLDERVKMLEELVTPFGNVVVDQFEGLTVNYMVEQNAQAIIRGLRAISDFESEFQMAITNKRLCPETETVFLMSKANWSFLSSSVVKEVALFGGDISGFVPPLVEKSVVDKFKQIQFDK